MLALRQKDEVTCFRVSLRLFGSDTSGQNLFEAKISNAAAAEPPDPVPIAPLNLCDVLKDPGIEKLTLIPLLIILVTAMEFAFDHSENGINDSYTEAPS